MDLLDMCESFLSKPGKKWCTFLELMKKIQVIACFEMDVVCKKQHNL